MLRYGGVFHKAVYLYYYGLICYIAIRFVLPGSAECECEFWFYQEVDMSPVNNVRGDNMSIELVHIGFGNILAMGRVIAIASPNSAPTKRTIHEGRNNGKVIDMTSGRRTKAVIYTDSGHIVLAALAPETIASRPQLSRMSVTGKQEQVDSADEP